VSRMKRLNQSAVRAAERFVWLSGRLIDRHRLAHLLHGDRAASVLAALRPYQNPDGGFGHALEPDLRGPISQPQPVEVALHVLDEVDAFSDPMVGAACDYLAGITTSDGGVPFVLPSVRPYPRAPWWETGDDPPASLNPTAAIAGLLHKHGVDHPWLGPATEFCWSRLVGLERTDAYEARASLLFLEHAPDRTRAEAVFDRLGALIAGQGLGAPEPDPEGQAHTRLDFAPAPGSIGRRLFRDDVIEAALDRLVAAQGEDGGWPVPWPVWTPATGPEWRAVLTIGALRQLRAYNRGPEAGVAGEGGG
jgi:hypothetical protein